MNYGFELMSEIIPLCIVAVLGIDMKKGGEKDFLPSIIILSIIEIPTLIVTLFCMFIKIPQSNSRHIMFFVEKKNRNIVHLNNRE